MNVRVGLFTQEVRMTDNATGAASAKSGPSEDAKAKFREALERKKALHHPTAEGGTKAGPTHGADPVAASQQTFRRKSG